MSERLDSIAINVEGYYGFERLNSFYDRCQNIDSKAKVRIDYAPLFHEVQTIEMTYAEFLQRLGFEV